MPLDRRPLRDHIVAEILSRLNEGSLPSGTRIDEVALATELEVSRTPVREALSQLAYEGVLEMQTGKGFKVAVLEATDIEAAYEVIIALELHALASIPSPRMQALAARLDTAAAAMEAVADRPDEAQQADDAWHEILLEAAGNGKLVQTVRRIKQGVRRAEYQMMTNSQSVLRSVAQHRAISGSLARGDLSHAASILDRNWRDGLRGMLSRAADEIGASTTPAEAEAQLR